MVALAARAALTLAVVGAAVTLNMLVAHAVNRNFLIFVGVAAALMVQVHVLFWFRVVAPFRRSRPVVFSAVKRAFFCFCAATYLGPPLAKLTPGYLLTEAALACVICNVWMLFLCGCFSLARAVSARAKAWSREGEAAVIIALLLVFAGAAAYEARREYEVNHVSVHLGLSHPLSVTLVSDLHFGPVLGGDFCERVAATVRRLDSDVTVLVGDIFDTNIEKLPPSVAKCVSGFFNRKGLFYVTGNHGTRHLAVVILCRSERGSKNTLTAG